MKRNPAMRHLPEDRLQGANMLAAVPVPPRPDQCIKAWLPHVTAPGNPCRSHVRRTPRPENGRDPVTSYFYICDAILAPGAIYCFLRRSCPEKQGKRCVDIRTRTGNAASKAGHIHAGAERDPPFPSRSTIAVNRLFMALNP